MSRPEEEVQAEIRLNAMLAELEERQQMGGDMPSDDEIFEIRALQAQAGKTAEQEAIEAYAAEAAEILGPIPEQEDPFAMFDAEPSIRFDNPFDQIEPDEDTVIDSPEARMPELTDFPEEPGTSRASIQLHELASTQAGLEMFLPEVEWDVRVDQEALDAMGGFEGLARASAATGAPMMPPMQVEGLGQFAENFGISMAAMTMSDPQEIADMMTQTVEFEHPETGEMVSTQLFPGVSQAVAPDGALILVNNHRIDPRTGRPMMALVNRPGFSMMDALQIVGIGSAYTPAGRYATVASAAARKAAVEATTETAKRHALREARRRSSRALMGGSAVTETALQAGQALAGGEFNVGDIAMSTAFGAVPDYVFDPLIRSATKIPSYLRGQIPASEAAELTGKLGAMEYADTTGRRLMTQDVLQEHITPPMAIFAKIVERIPIVGTGPARKQMTRERADALKELAEKYGIDVNSDYGTRVMESFVERMTNQRFWGRNQEIIEGVGVPVFGAGSRKGKERAQALLDNAWIRESEEVINDVLAKAIKDRRIDDAVLDAVINSNNPRHMAELFERLTPAGQQAAKQRFILQGLEKASWSPDGAGGVNPTAMMQFLNKPSSRKLIEQWFNPEEQMMLRGMREYLRLTEEAAKTAKGAGMVAAGATAGGAGIGFMAGVLDALFGLTAVTAAAGHGYQSKWMRNKLVQLAHTAGNDELTGQIMAQLRPYMVAAENQWKMDNFYFPEANISRDSLTEAAVDIGEYGLELGSEALGEIAQTPENIMEFIQGKD